MALNTWRRATNGGNIFPRKFIIIPHLVFLTSLFNRFFGTAGTAIVTKDDAYLFTDSRYWSQARQQLDTNWRLVKAGGVGEPKDWIEWLVVSDDCFYLPTAFHNSL